MDKEYLNAEEIAQVKEQIRDYHDTFLLPGNVVPATNVVQLEIIMDNEMPIVCKQHRLHSSIEKSFERM